MAADINPKKSESGGLLMSVINTLTNSADFSQREKEKSKLERGFKTSDDVLDKLVTDNHQDLMLILQSFTTITDRITASQARVRVVKENLESCKNLLHCKRDELRKLWLEGVEQKTVVALLDQIDHLRQVPDKLDAHLAQKQYLQATQLIVEAVAAVEGDLAGVEALRDLAAELKAKKEKLLETLTDELHRQIYIKSTSVVVRGFQRHGSTRPGTRSSRRHITSTTSAASTQDNTLSPRHAGVDPSRPPADESGTEESVSGHVRLITILVESLAVLGKLAETNEAIKTRIEQELLAIIQRASQQVSDNAYQQGESGSLGQQQQPKYLLELLTLVFQEFRCVARAHRTVLDNMKRLMEPRHGDVGDLYTMEYVWARIQGVLQYVLTDYLDIRCATQPAVQVAGFDEPNANIAQFFSRKRAASKPKRTALFRFDSSSHAISMNSYLREQRQEFYGSGEILNRVDASEVGKQLFVCKPGANNVTVIYNPLMKFVKEIEQETGTTESTLQSFITDYTRNIFLSQVHYNITNSIHSATKIYDAFKMIIDQRTQKTLGVPRPLLQSTVIVSRNLDDLRELMRSMPDYADNFMNMMRAMLHEYRETCRGAYRSIINVSVSDDRQVTLKSASWAKDPDITRLLRSLPNWQRLKQPELVEDLNISEEDRRALNCKESQILTSSMETDYHIITETTQLRSLANMHESLEWFSAKIASFAEALPTESGNLTITVPDPSSPAKSAHPPTVTCDAVKTLLDLSADALDLSEICLLVLHLELRFHCLSYLLPVTKESKYHCVPDMDLDPKVVDLNRDLSAIDEALGQSLRPEKCKYVFEGVGHLIATILISNAHFIAKIDDNGIKRMSRNIFSIQQNLTSITACREPDLDHVRQYYELLYLKADDILTVIMEQGPQFNELEYITIFQILHKSSSFSEERALHERLQRLKEILHEKHV